MTTLNKNALTTIQAVKDRLGISSNDEDDYIATQINRLSDLFERETGRKWYNTDGDYTEKVASYDRTRLQINDHLPVSSITSITYDSGNTSVLEDPDSYDLENSKTGWIRSLNGVWTGSQPGYSKIDHYQVPETNEPNYTVVYQGGYITPKQDNENVGTRDLPYDIEEAIINQVIAYREEKTRNKNVASLKVGDASIKWASSSSSSKRYGSFIDELGETIRRYQIHTARFV